MKIIKLLSTFSLFAYIGLITATGTINPAEALFTDTQRAKIESTISEITEEEAEDTADFVVVDKDVDAASVKRLNKSIEKLPEEIIELIEKEGLKVILTGNEKIFERVANKDENITGFYYEEENVIYIRRYYENISTLHEIGHFVEAHSKNNDFSQISEREGHKKLLEKIGYGENNIEYLLSDNSEYFASCFHFFYEEPKLMKKFQPKTFDYFLVFL